MLDIKILQKLESLTQIPTIPYVITQVLNAVDDDNLSASALASIIEKDPALTMRVLTVANSSFYGFSRRISTIDLAIVIMGLNTIKEIVLSLAIQRFFAKVRKDLFDIKEFWRYSVFCGAASRVIARKFNYKLAGEAFVSGLIHDIGILILIQYFPQEFEKIRNLQATQMMSFVQAEKEIIDCTHSDIGAWLVKKWKLPEKIENSVILHHLNYNEGKQLLKALETERANEKLTNQNIRISYGDSINSETDENIDEPLAVIVALAEWFAGYIGLKNWAMEMNNKSPLFMAEDIVQEMMEDEVLSPNGALQIIRQEIIDEYNKANILTELESKQLKKYKAK